MCWARGAARTLALRGTYLLSNQEPTLDEPVQHLLTGAVGRLAGLREEKHHHPQRACLGGGGGRVADS